MIDFRMRIAVDVGAAFAGLSTAIGGRLGLYVAMAGAGPLTSAELAAKTELDERYLREWLAAQVAGEYVDFDPATDTYLLPDEHAAVLADPSSPMYAIGSFFMIKALYATEDKLVDAFRTGAGVGWEEHHPALFEGVAAFFRPGYAASLVPEWLPAMPGVVAKLERGASVADVGCGHGHSTLLMAKAFPNSTFTGYDFHAPSIEAARENAAEQGVSDRVTFAVATAQTFPEGHSPGKDYDLIAFFDCLHDLGDPEGALRRAEQTLAQDGTVMIVEPNASPNVLDNRNPIGRSFSSSSVVVCLPAALAQHGPQALGNHAGEAAMQALADRAGLRDWRLVLETLANRVYAAKRG